MNLLRPLDHKKHRPLGHALNAFEETPGNNSIYIGLRKQCDENMRRCLKTI
jgi:hypothetical protein